MLDELNPIWKTVSAVRYRLTVMCGAEEFADWHTEELSVQATKIIDEAVSQLVRAGVLIDAILAALPDDVRTMLYNALKEKGMI